MQKRVIYWLLLFFVIAASESLAEPLTTEQTAYFEQHVRPLLIERCYKCHAEEKQVKGGLRLDSRPGWQTGGDNGPAIVPGKPDESLLIKAVRYQNADLQMPPAGKLTDAEIKTLEEWVRQGAADPRDQSTTMAPKSMANTTTDHWAYQPLDSVSLPAVSNERWCFNETDRFILAALDAKGLRASPDADRYSWLRRVSLDLTGLPPSTIEINAFTNDLTAQAFETVVDRLLASPAFGERWARPWLDLVGYADQIGSANNVPAEHAWRYRDYVIRSLNADKPFDEFIREQIAGDLLKAGSIEQRQDQLTATGFLVLGNVNIVEGDKLVMRMDLVDQQIEKVGKTFLGMTLNCARCHDHKFDPITLNDYYGLAGIFSSTDSTYRESRGVWSSVTKSQLPETLDQFTRRQAALRIHEQKTVAIAQERSGIDSRVKDLAAQIKALKETPEKNAEQSGSIERLEKEQTELAAKLPGLDQKLWHLNYVEPSTPLSLSVKDAPEISDAKIQIRGNPHTLGTQVSRGFVRVATHGDVPTIDNQQSGRVQLAEWLTHAAKPLVSRVTVNRIWSRLFGRGIVGSVDYFGVRGERPTHPELLEYLAGRFINEGWSQKRLIRHMVLSRAYRQRSDVDDGTHKELAADPDNHYYWRTNPRRLDAEMLRDAVLFVSGELEACSGGPALAPEFPENVGGLNPTDVNPISFSLSKFRENQQHLRTIYLPVVRSSDQRGPADVLNFFDFPQPAQFTGSRPMTAVASQTLYLLNGPLLKNASQRLASELVTQTDLTTDEERITRIHLRLLNRLPNTEEIQASLTFLTHKDQPASNAAVTPADSTANWQSYIHALLASNEFLFRL